MMIRANEAAIRIMEVVYLLIVLVALMLIVLVARTALAGTPSMVRIFEARFGAPGTPHVVPECGCTFRYVGTKVEGQDFYVHFRQLD